MHVPVLMKEVLEYLQPNPDQNFVDCTIGDAGHGVEILKRIAPNGRLLGIDADPEAIAEIKNQKSKIKDFDRLVLAQGNFRDLASVVEALRKAQDIKLPIHGILLDLGFSSSTLERGRGFTFLKDELLDMRFDTSKGIRAAEIVNGWNQKQLAELLEEYGEEKLARQIAVKIVAERKNKPIVTSGQLAQVVVEAYREKLTPMVSLRGAKRCDNPPAGDRHAPARLAMTVGEERIPWIGGLHPATRTFQALRIAVNDELNALQEVLPQAVEILEPGGRLAVIAFHSLEDRIVKQFFKGYSDGKIKLLTKKPVVPSDAEIKNNPRSRSAKMRVIEKIDIH